MKKVIILLSVLVLFISRIQITQAAEIENLDINKSEIRHDVRRYFDETGVFGSFVVYDLKNDRYTYYNPTRCFEKSIPASTFKIPNSLIGLETGVIPDQDFLIKWNGEKSNVTPDWDRDHTLRSAFKYSALWYYQELARRVGEERMQSYINNLGYGNRNISGGIDKFWLTGDLRISQMEQIQFLRNLYSNQLPFSQRSMDIVKDIMIKTKESDYTLRAKTGWAILEKDIGWYVGYIEKGDNTYFFATNIESERGNKNFGKARIEITDKILADFGIL